jgi:hypothetical protein
LPPGPHVGVRRDLFCPLQGLPVCGTREKSDFAHALLVVGEDVRFELTKGLSL